MDRFVAPGGSPWTLASISTSALRVNQTGGSIRPAFSAPTAAALDIAVKDERIVGVRGDARSSGQLRPSRAEGRKQLGRQQQPAARHEADDPAAQGRCAGAGRAGPRRWTFFVENFRAAWKQGHENLACYNSGQLTIEEFYTLGKLWRGGLQSSNIDGNTRLCTATSATGLMANFGADGPVACYVDIDQADLLCLYGHNVAETQTVLWERMLAAKRRNGGRIIVADPRKSPTVRQGADLHLQLKLGTNVALMNGLIHLLFARGYVDRDFVAAHTVGFEQMEAVAREYPPERVAEICGIPAETWRGRPSGSARHRNGLDRASGLLPERRGDGGLVAGQLGSSSARRNRQTGQRAAADGWTTFGDVQPRGGRGRLLSGLSQSAQPAAHARDRGAVESRPRAFHPEVPKDIMTMLETAERGEIEFLWVIGTNPIVSLPDQNRTRRDLEKLFLVVQDPFIDAESVELADIYLPVAMWGEKTGCVTNADRSVNSAAEGGRTAGPSAQRPRHLRRGRPIASGSWTATAPPLHPSASRAMPSRSGAASPRDGPATTPE